MDFVAIGALEGPAFDQAMQATAMGVSAGILAAGPDTPAMRGRVKALKEAGADVSAIALGEQARVDCDAITRHEGLLTRARGCTLNLDAPVEAINHAAALLRRVNCAVVLHPARPVALNRALLFLTGYVACDGAQLAAAAGVQAGSVDQAFAAADQLTRMGAGMVVNPRADGCALVYTRAGRRVRPPMPVNGRIWPAHAGVCAGALGAALAMGLDGGDGAQLALAAGTLFSAFEGGFYPMLEQAVSLVEFGDPVQ